MNKKYRVLWDDSVYSDFKSIDKSIAKKIIEKVENYLSRYPKNLGKPLQANLSGLYRYRFGDYRVIYELKEHELIILVVKISHRKNAYD